MEINAFIQNYNLEIKAVNKNGLFLKYIINQTLEICVLALQNTMDAYKYVNSKFIYKITSMDNNGYFGNKFRSNPYQIIVYSQDPYGILLRWKTSIRDTAHLKSKL
jgi:hypothetical protein